LLQGRGVRLVVDALLAATLAPGCAVCACPLDAPTRGSVCDFCWNQVRLLTPPLCRTCGDPLPSWCVISQTDERCALCRRHAGSVDMARAAGDYEGPLRGILQAFKYDGRRSLGRRLGDLMRAAGGDVLRDAECVVPVPLHPWRRFRRGFNQAADLAARLDLPIAHALWRARATAPQAGLSAAARRRNVRGAFRISPLLSRASRESLLHDRVVVVVDDVRTTGATLNACAQVLKDTGAREVRALTAARAVPRARQ